MGLLDVTEDPQTMGLLSLGLRLMSTPGKFGTAFGQAGLGAMGDMQAAKQAQAQAQAQALQRQMAQLQLQQAQAAAAKQKQIQDLAAASMRPAATGLPSIMTGSGYRTPMDNTARQQAIGELSEPKFDAQMFANKLAGIDAMAAIPLQQSLAKQQAKLKSIEPMRGPDGKMVNVAFFEDGTHKVLPYGVKPEIALQSLGNRVVAIDKNDTPSGASFAMGASPDALVNANVTMRGQNMNDSRARELNAITREGNMTQFVNDPNLGPMLVNRGTGVMRPAVGVDGKPMQSETSAKQTVAANKTLKLVDEAEAVIKDSTESYLGAGIDLGARAVGISTKGAKAAAKLKVLQGNLMLSQPRMEGPQSDSDRKLYAEMAGQIGDSTVPSDVKQAALDTIRALNEKYLGLAPGSSRHKGPTLNSDALRVPVLRFDANGQLIN